MRLNGKTALVTGAGNGIGRGIATALAEEGARVAVTDIDKAAAARTVDSLTTRGLDAFPLQLDVTNPDQIGEVVTEAYRRMGSLKVLVNNVGGPYGYAHRRVQGNILDVAPDQWDGLMALNLKSTYLVCRAALPFMIDSGGGSIINVSSIAAITVYPGQTVYAAAKAGVISLTRGIALDFVDKGIRANVICPGNVDTSALASSFRTEPDPDAAKRRRAAEMPMQRLGDPMELGSVAAFLASDEASFVTATVNVVDGGISAVGKGWRVG